MVPPLFSGGLHIRTHKALSQSFCSVTAACRHSLLKGHPFVRCTAREGIPLQPVIAPLTSRQLSVMRPCSVLVSVIAFRVFAYYKIKGVKCQEERGDREPAPVSPLSPRSYSSGCILFMPIASVDVLWSSAEVVGRIMPATPSAMSAPLMLTILL